MERHEILDRALTAFFRFGYRKSSMDAIAQTVGLSRQSLYNHFDNKRELFRATMIQAFSSSAERAATILADDSLPLAERLLEAFDTWAGVHVEALRASPFAADVLMTASEEFSEENADAHAALHKQISEALAPTHAEVAPDIATALTLASKGLCHGTADRAGYREEMTTVIRVALSHTPSGDSKKRRKTS